MKRVNFGGRLYYILFRSDSDKFKKYSTVRAKNSDNAFLLALRKYNHVEVFNVISSVEFLKRSYLLMGFEFLEDISV